MKEEKATGWKAFRAALKPQEGVFPRAATAILNPPKNLNTGLAADALKGPKKAKPKSESTNEKLASDTVARSPNGCFKSKKD